MPCAICYCHDGISDANYLTKFSYSEEVHILSEFFTKSASVTIISQFSMAAMLAPLKVGILRKISLQ
jgi:hypothetical protein